MTDLSPYAGRWVALVGGQVAGVGYTAEAALRAAQHSRPRERATLQFVEAPDGEPLSLPTLLVGVRALLADQQPPVYLVGGAIRDALLGRASYDLDFVTSGRAVRLAFRVADALGAPAFVLDPERDTGRVVLAAENTVLDFAHFRGADLDADLRARDFTINALAMPVAATTLPAVVDPTGGLDDLRNRLVHLTHGGALEDDPLRTLRAVRLATDLRFSLTAETAAAIVTAIPGLANVTAERIRDELLKVMATPRPAEGLALMEELELLPAVLPEIAALKGIPQSPPHYQDVLAHTRATLRWLVRLEKVILAGEEADQDALRLASQILGELVPDLRDHLQRPIDGSGLNGVTLLRLGALFHDAGKAPTMTVDEAQRVRFLGHEKVGADLAGQRLRQLCLSREAVAEVKRIVSGHMRPLLLQQAQGAELSRRAVYRFFQAAGKNGVDICLLSLADHLATYELPGEQQSWKELLQVTLRLCEHYFHRPQEAVHPVPLLNGGDLIAHLGLEPGPEIGRLLRLLEEGQAAGEITTREEALRFARQQRE